MSSILGELLPVPAPPGVITEGTPASKWLRRLPAEAACRYNELRFDCALMLWRRMHVERLGTAYRLMQIYSSPRANHDWLWARFTEIAERDVAETAKTVCLFEHAVNEFKKKVEFLQSQGK